MKDDISIQAGETGTGEETAGQAEIRPEETLPEESPSDEGPKSPRRYKLYDRFADHVSLRTIDAVILITAVLIIGLLIYGILTGSPQ